MAFELTKAQSAAVHTRGRSVLVSAAAGSGKTRVLTERLMAYVTDPDDPRDIDSFLIITYTRAAAAELRSRILSELSARAAQNPENRRLRRQTNLCYRAQIGTIHSFCATVLRENCHLLGLTPDFAVADEDKCARMKAAALEKLLTQSYEGIETDGAFRALVDTVGAGRDDARLGEVILKLHSDMQSHAYPEKWAGEQMAALTMVGVDDAGETVWGKYLLDTASQTAEYWRGEINCLLERLYACEEQNEAIIKAYGASLSGTAAGLDRLCIAVKKGWDSVRSSMPVPFERLKGLRSSPDPELSDRIKSRREACKKAMAAVEEQFSAPSRELLRDMAKTAPAMKRLLELALEFDRLYARAKEKAGVLDFSDLEHLACRLLADSENGLPTALAEEISRRYTEIMVDEYQDVNAVQDLIFQSVSQNGKNLFMVGDVKQSIYRFRLADPGIFIDKYERFSDSSREDSPGLRILLQENFRSRNSVLSAANHVFSNIMSAELGEIDYDEAAALKCGADYPPEGEKRAEMRVFSMDGADDDEESPTRTEFEAVCVAEKIRDLAASGETVYENGKPRKLGYGDIVILLRSPGGAGGAYRRALTRAGIPVAEAAGEGFFSSAEIMLAVSLLAVIDNPRQDVPLLAVLSSPVFGMSADDLAQIRASNRGGDIYSAVAALGEKNQKCGKFLEFLTKMRAMAPDMPTDELLSRVLDETDLTAICAAMPDGAMRLRNLAALMEYAGRFEQDGYRGLFRFNAWLERMAENGEEPPVAASGGGEDAVRIMSIHKSKGLEFPVVFLCDTARRFNRRDIMGPVLCHPRLGLGPKFIDADRGIEYPTLARAAVSKMMVREMLSEEMRVLYVAMTRAKERLFVTCAVKDGQKLVQKLSAGVESPLPPAVLEGASAMCHWLIQTALLPDSPMELLVESRTAVTEGEELPESTSPAPQPDESAMAVLTAAQEWEYPHKNAQNLPSKLTATELKGGEEPDGEASRFALKQDVFDFRVPDLSGMDRELTPSEKGTAAHLVMQFIDFSRTGSRQEVEEELLRLARQGFITEKQAQCVNPGTVTEFFASDTGRRIKCADKVVREFPFSLLCPAGDFFPEGGEEQVLLQGVIDCFIVENGGITIVDYKTDNIPAEKAGERTESYLGQLRAYAAAVQRITGLPVRQAVLYFLKPGVCREISL